MSQLKMGGEADLGLRNNWIPPPDQGQWRQLWATIKAKRWKGFTIVQSASRLLMHPLNPLIAATELSFN
jgi:hypothetical protein